MKLFKVYAIQGDYLGLMTVEQLTALFKQTPGLWVSIHARREDWPETPSGEFNESSWLEWCKLYDRSTYVARKPGLYETLYELVSAVQSSDASVAVKDAARQHACCMLAIADDSTIEDVLELLKAELQ